MERREGLRRESMNPDNQKKYMRQNEYIIITNLSERTTRLEVCDREQESYGRLLAIELIRKYGNISAGRNEGGNVIVLVPGLLTGNPAPSVGRMFIATNRGGADGVQICNITGNMPEALSSNGIAAVVIQGIYSRGNGILRIAANPNAGAMTPAERTSEAGPQMDMPETDGGMQAVFTVGIEDLAGAAGRNTDRIVRALRARYGKDAAAIGIGPAGERKLAISALFSTYAAGYPEYYVPRNSFGDVFGSKGLRAVVVESDLVIPQRFRGMVDPERFTEQGTALANLICQNDICGKALPSYGATVLQSGLRDGEVFRRYEEVSVRRISCLAEVDNVHRACTPYCVIGCLNRHVSKRVGRRKSTLYRDPLNIEAEAKLRELFDIDDTSLTEDIVERTSGLGISSTEYIEMAKLYSECTNSKGTPSKLRKWLEEIQQDTVIGRMIGGGRNALVLLYPDSCPSRQSEEREWEKQIDPALQEELTALDNLGFCVFAAFAIVGNEEAWKCIAGMMEAQTGEPWTKERILRQSRRTMTAESEYTRDRADRKSLSNLPKFAGILQDYIETRK